MGQIISTSDFASGEYAIATDVYSIDNLEAFITANETNILYKMLGVDLCALFLANLDGGTPTDQRFLELFNSWWKQINDVNVQSKGIKDLLIKHIYFLFVRKQSEENTLNGQTQSQGSISQPSKMLYMSLTLTYNDAIKTSNAIQTYIEDNLDTYPEYNGETLEFISI